jgi:hypothetical protein
MNPSFLNGAKTYDSWFPRELYKTTVYRCSSLLIGENNFVCSFNQES